MKSCEFCNVSKEKGFDILYEDDSFVAFGDHKPAAEHHIELVPKIHITSVRSLQQRDVELVQSMKSIGAQLLDDLSVPVSMRIMGFHIPPFNSIGHLHLHVQALPYKPLRQAKYPISKGFGPLSKGFGWFVDVDQAIRILNSGRSIGVFPC